MRGGVGRKPNPKMRGDEQKPDYPAGRPKAGGNEADTANRSISPVPGHELTPGQVFEIVEDKYRA